MAGTVIYDVPRSGYPSYYPDHFSFVVSCHGAHTVGRGLFFLSEEKWFKCQRVKEAIKGKKERERESLYTSKRIADNGIFGGHNHFHVGKRYFFLFLYSYFSQSMTSLEILERRRGETQLLLSTELICPTRVSNSSIGGFGIVLKLSWQLIVVF
jgi:hypothetical protein